MNVQFSSNPCRKTHTQRHHQCNERVRCILCHAPLAQARQVSEDALVEASVVCRHGQIINLAKETQDPKHGKQNVPPLSATLTSESFVSEENVI